MPPHAIGAVAGDRKRVERLRRRLADLSWFTKIPDGLRPILERLDVDASRWSTAMAATSRLFGTAIGSEASLATEAVRRGTRRVVGALDVYRVN